MNDFVDAVPGYVEDLTAGRGQLGFLEREYHITERVREALSEGGASKLLGISGTALAVTKGVVTAIVATLTITFLTLFMLLEGPAWVERLYSLLPEEKQPRWRKIGHDIYRTIGGYVTGNLAISLIAGIVSTAVLPRRRRSVRGRARAARRDPRPDPARGRHDRRDPRHARSRSSTRPPPG